MFMIPSGASPFGTFSFNGSFSKSEKKHVNTKPPCAPTPPRSAGAMDTEAGKTW